ncbi:hypothetical protein B5807_10694 [Epicoccum nigrum]|uniref:Secreted protein n=1 Tax=Epicoccum nigrum TaxID=105696 RepID=A0A1Y2LKZ3_EPING|nr:hypothetical protein B5807_10694 [Epicoccum nigrum]
MIWRGFLLLVSCPRAASALMTRPRVLSDLLIWPPSFSCWPVACVDLARSEPARSTRRMRAVRSMVSSDVMECVICLRRMVNTAWEREEVSFILVAATVRLCAWSSAGATWPKQGHSHVVALSQVLGNFGVTLDFFLAQSLDIDAVLGALADLEVDGRNGGGHEQVADVLVVDFEVGDLDVVGGVGLRLVLDAVEQLLAGAANQARVVVGAHHGVALARARLAVGEDARVVAAEVVVEEFLAERLVHVLLGGIVRVGLVVRPEGAVEGKLLVLDERAALVVWSDLGRKQRRLLGGWVHADQALGALVALCKTSY